MRSWFKLGVLRVIQPTFCVTLPVVHSRPCDRSSPGPHAAEPAPSQRNMSIAPILAELGSRRAMFVFRAPLPARRSAIVSFDRRDGGGGFVTEVPARRGTAAQLRVAKEVWLLGPGIRLPQPGMTRVVHADVRPLETTMHPQTLQRVDAPPG